MAKSGKVKVDLLKPLCDSLLASLVSNKLKVVFNNHESTK